jgi:hypothetical protein
MDRWDVLIVVVAGYLAIMALVRLMAHRRAEVINQVRHQIAQQQGNSKKKRNASKQDAA